jgi:hypothetical protein
MIFFGVINRILGDFNDQIRFSHDGLARQTGLGRQTPGAIEHIFFIFIGLIETPKALAHDHMTGGASAHHIAGMFNFNIMGE